MNVALSSSVREEILPYMRLFMKRKFPNIQQEFQTAQVKPGKPERIHSDSKSSQTASNFKTSWIQMQRGAGDAEDSFVFYVCDGDKWSKKGTRWQVPIPIKDKVTATELQSILRKAWEAAGGEASDLDDL
ncbi:hypothetical protein FB451DRAFT_1240146 [Mycena latifolia]|nr:hypothetical protein FB451DRAFT_1240146 [Mycena latifolia]